MGDVRVTPIPSSGTARSAEKFLLAELLPTDDTLHKGTGTAVKSETKHQVRAQHMQVRDTKRDGAVQASNFTKKTN